MVHVLSGCPVSLATGRYRKRHNAVLKVLANYLQMEINVGRGEKVVANPKSQPFIKPDRRILPNLIKDLGYYKLPMIGYFWWTLSVS